MLPQRRQLNKPWERDAESGEEWFTERRVSIAKKKSRTQMQWHLQLAGDWHSTLETAVPRSDPHMMRVLFLTFRNVLYYPRRAT